MSPPTSANAIDGFAWSHRPLVLYAPSADSPEMSRQRSLLLEVRDDLRKRDIVLIEVVGDEATIVVGPEARIEAPALIQRLGLSDDRFGVALVGKDTGVKLRSNEVVTVPQLFSLIDAIPMRRREIRERGDDNS